MKKSMKILSVILIAIMLVMSVAPIASAMTPGQIAASLNEPADNVTGTSDLLKIAKSVIGIINIVAVVIAVIILLVLGIKYMMGSASEKAEYKKSMIPYLIGAFIIFAAPTLVNILINLFGNFGVQ